MLKAYSVQQLNHISKKKEIWCFGCGKRFHDMLDFYDGEPFITKISVLLDSNPLLWKKKKKVGKKELSIDPPEIMDGGKRQDSLAVPSCRREHKNVIIIITSDHYQEIYEHISESLIKRGMDCSRYPVYYHTYSTFLMAVCRLFPIRRQMLFCAGCEPHENAKALAEYLRKRYQGKRYCLVFAVDKEPRKSHKTRNKKIPPIVFINRNALKCRNGIKQKVTYCFYTATSQYIFYENEPLEKIRDKQVLIYLNHGTIPLKNVSDVLRQPEELDYALCPSKGCSDIYRQQYHIPKEKLLYGMPPRDDFLKKKTNKQNRIIDAQGKQVIIWLPTFRSLKGSSREDSVTDDALSLISRKEDLAELEQHLRNNGQILLIKYHPREKQQSSRPISYDNIKLLSEEELKAANATLQEILGGTAALLTDYSGISFEYLLLNRPIGYVVKDMEDYTRGFAFKNFQDYMPGAMIRTVDELKKFLDDVKAGRDEFQDHRKALMEKLFQGNQLRSGSQELIRQLEELERHKTEYRKRRMYPWISGNSFVRN